jgi:glycosyltransferase involved in cell wall biosynthesis
VERPDRSVGLLVCLTYHLPNISGLTLSAHQIAKHVHALGYTSHIVAGRAPKNMAKTDLVDGVLISRVTAFGRLGKALVMPGYASAVWRASASVTTVNVHLPSLDAAVVAVVARLRGKQLIVSHISSMSKATMAARLMRALAAVPHVIAGLLAHRVVTVSQDYAEASVFCRLFRKKLVTAPYPISLPLFAHECPNLRKPRNASPENPFRIGYVGRIAAQKSLAVLLDAIPLLSKHIGVDFVVELLGPASDIIGETHWQDILANATMEGGHVRYCGVKTGEELSAFYTGLDVLVLPSMDRLESFGLVQVEAMLRGVPVVASDMPGMRLPVQATQMGFLFEPGNVTSLANALARILTEGPPVNCPPDQVELLFGNAVACKPYVDMLVTAQVQANLEGQ